MKTIEIPVELGQALVNYLQSKPYGEVWQLIQALLEAAKEPQKGGPAPVERVPE